MHTIVCGSDVYAVYGVRVCSNMINFQQDIEEDQPYKM